MLGAFLYAQDTLRSSQTIQPPFDVNEVIKKVTRNRQEEFPTTGEFLIDTGVVYGAAPMNQLQPSVTFDGTNYFIVWEDSRSTDYDIYGTRVSQEGKILDSCGIIISRDLGQQQNPSVAFDGLNYLVVWQEVRPFVTYSDIYGARVTKDGIVLDPEEIAVCIASDQQGSPTVTFGNTKYLVVWNDLRRKGYRIYGSRVDRSGVVLDPNGFAISKAVSNNQFAPVGAFDGVNFLIAWTDYRGTPATVYAARVDENGSVLDSTDIAISGGSSPSVSFDGTNYFIVWHDGRSGAGFDIYGGRVTTSGVLLDTLGIAISTASNNQLFPSIVFGSRDFLVSWEDNRGISSDIYGARVTRDGIVLDTSGITISTASKGQYRPAVGFGSNGYLAMWHDDSTGSDYDVFYRRVDQNGGLVDSIDILITISGNGQYLPAVASDGSDFLVGWEDMRAGARDIYGARTNSAGIVLDPRALQISTAHDNQYHPSIAFDGANYFIVWEDRRSGLSSDIFGSRISPSGLVLDTSGFVVSDAADNQCCPAVAFNGSKYLAAWHDARVAVGIYGARVHPSGTVIDTNGFVIANPSWQQKDAALVSGDSNWLVVWEDERSMIYWGVYGARVSDAGLVLDSMGILIAEGNSVVPLNVNPAVAFDGLNYLAVWQKGCRAPLSYEIFGARLSQGGTLLDPSGFNVSNEINDQVGPSISFDGVAYQVVWRGDARDPDSYFNIYGARVSPAGVVIDSFVVSTQPGIQSHPAVTHGSGDQCLVVWSGWTDSINHRPANTMRIWGKLLPQVGIAERSMLKAKRSMFEIYPNPFLKRTAIKFQMSKSKCKITLKIYDVTGRAVKCFNLSSSLVHHPSSFVTWHGSDDSGRKLPAGVYFCILKCEDMVISKKIVKIE